MSGAMLGLLLPLLHFPESAPGSVPRVVVRLWAWTWAQRGGGPSRRGGSGDGAGAGVGGPKPGRRQGTKGRRPWRTREGKRSPCDWDAAVRIREPGAATPMMVKNTGRSVCSFLSGARAGAAGVTVQVVGRQGRGEPGG
jgi:hypothetical protein